MFGKREKTSVSDLHPTADIDEKKAQYFADKGKGYDKPIQVITDEKGQKHVQDGHHRLAGALARGEEEVETEESNLPEEIKKSWLGKIFGD